ncbi:MAG: BadF/BadG/BcrA/BcrD ATPase family protein [Roseiflexaceae bacterium]
MIVGVDVGGTKTYAVMCDINGHVLARVQFGTGNWESIGLAAAATLYAEIVQSLCTQAGVATHQIAASAWGLAGLDWPSDELRLHPLIAPLFNEIPLTLVNDAFLPLRAGTRHSYGVGVIAGTGSTVAGIGVDGQRARNFGLGRTWAGFDGASQLATEAMRMATEAYFGRRAPTRLTEALCQWGSVSSIPALAESLSRGELNRDVASFAPFVMHLAGEGDDSAQEIIHAAAMLLADNALAVIAQLDMQQLEFDVVLAGGVATNATPSFYQTMLTAIHRESPRAQLVRLRDKPVLGALLLAFDSLNYPIEPEVLEQLRAEV